MRIFLFLSFFAYSVANANPTLPRDVALELIRRVESFHSTSPRHYYFDDMFGPSYRQDSLPISAYEDLTTLAESPAVDDDVKAYALRVLSNPSVIGKMGNSFQRADEGLNRVVERLVRIEPLHFGDILAKLSDQTQPQGDPPLHHQTRDYLRLRHLDDRSPEVLRNVISTVNRYFAGGSESIRLLEQKRIRTPEYLVALLESAYDFGNYRSHSPVGGARETLNRWRAENPSQFDSQLDALIADPLRFRYYGERAGIRADTAQIAALDYLRRTQNFPLTLLANVIHQKAYRNGFASISSDGNRKETDAQYGNLIEGVLANHNLHGERLVDFMIQNQHNQDLGNWPQDRGPIDQARQEARNRAPLLAGVWSRAQPSDTGKAKLSQSIAPLIVLAKNCERPGGNAVTRTLARFLGRRKD